jgi:hypothetical protein
MLPRPTPKRAPFFSGLWRAVEDPRFPHAARGLDLARHLSDPKRGVKRAELVWSGLQEFLVQNASATVTREQVRAFLQENQVVVQERVLGGDGAVGPAELDHIVSYLQTRGEKVDRMAVSIDQAKAGERRGHDALFLAGVPDELLEPLRSRPAAKFPRYTLPLGKNYRELLLMLPPSPRQETKPYDLWRAENMAGILDAEPTRKLYAIQRGRLLRPEYEGVHYDEPNILVQIRLTDRQGPPKPLPEGARLVEVAALDHDRPRPGTGLWRVQLPGGALLGTAALDRARAEATARAAYRERVLFVEEIQSDWAQDGRRRGFAAPDRTGARLRVLHTRLEELEERARRLEASASQEASRVPGSGLDLDTERHRVQKQIRALHEELRREEGRPASSLVPAGPFVGKTELWVTLAVKRVLHLALEEGFDRVAWTTGDQQAARYDLNKEIERVVAVKVHDGYNIWVTPKGQREISLAREASPQRVAELLGKDLSEKVLQTGGGEYSGLELKVGGAGMRAFYDGIVPSVARRLLARWGAPLEPVAIAAGSEREDLGPAERAALDALQTREPESLSEEDRARLDQLWQEQDDLRARPRRALEVSVHSFALSAAMRRDVLDQEQPLFKVIALDHGRFGPRERFTAERVQAAFPTARLSAVPPVLNAGALAFRLELPSGGSLRVEGGSRGIAIAPQAFERAYGRPPRPGEVALGTYRRGGWLLDEDGIIQLAKYATSGTLDHEAFHAALDLALGPRERRAVLARFGSEEEAAEAYARWVPDQSAETLFAKILEFFRRLVEVLLPEWERVFRAVKRGEVWLRSPQPSAKVASAEYATAAKLSEAELARDRLLSWFGRSQVRGADGSPLRVYHGTTADAFESFDKARQDPGALYGPGFYFTESAELAGGVVVREEVWSYHDREAEAIAQPRRTHFVWRDEASAQWVAIAEGPAVFSKRGYAHKTFNAQDDVATRARVGEAVIASRDYARSMDVDYLTESERENVRRWLGQYLEHGRRSVLELLEDQPYNIRVGRILDRHGLSVVGSVLPVYLRIEQPFDVDAPVTPEVLRRIYEAAAAKGGPAIATARDKAVAELHAGRPWRGEDVHRDLVEVLGRPGANQILRAAGFDGLTHIGGKRFGGPQHRVWVAFEPQQIKSALSNRSFDPEDERLSYRVAAPPLKRLRDTLAGGRAASARPER